MDIRDLIEELRRAYPYGHAEFIELTMKEIALHSAKNHDYAKGGSPLGNFDRVAAILALYPHLSLGDPRVVALVYALKQLDAVLWGISEGIEHKVEGLNARLQDISVYAKLVICMQEDHAIKAAFPLKELSSLDVQQMAERSKQAAQHARAKQIYEGGDRDETHRR